MDIAPPRNMPGPLIFRNRPALPSREPVPGEPARSSPFTSGPMNHQTTILRDILGVPVLAATPDEAAAALDLALSPDMSHVRPVLVAFLNAHISNLAAENAEFAAVMRKALVLNDGVGVDIASRLLHGAPFPANLNGTDFVPFYLAATRLSLRIQVVGAAGDVARRAMAELARIAPQHSYVGARDGYFTDGAGVAADILAARPDLVLVGMGSPRQELWAARHVAVPGGAAAFCVGGLLDFIAGEKPRAPALMRRLRLEWVYRLLLEPRRMWRRYLPGNAAFMTRLFAALRRRSPG